ncbi:MAG: nitroreductase family protein [Alphaproteobacteria bacterium]|nr:nitroreductase family protein [Alphaproteobacteria bacterium]
MLTTLRANLALARNAYYDYRRYAKASFAVRSAGRENRRAIIRILTHYIEGGMSFPDVRLGYGQEKIQSIIAKLRSYVADYEVDETVLWSLATLQNYLDYHRSAGNVPPGLEEEVSQLRTSFGLSEATEGGGSEIVRAEEIQRAVDFDFASFLQNRHSVRQYRPGPVDDETIRRVVANAQQSPNVCNRQTCKVYALNRRDDVQAILEYQAGNAGFRQEIETVFVITANMEHLNLIGERYQGWIDGGIFAMTLALSLHAEGLGACFLNWSVELEQDRALRDRLKIPDGELVITMMSAGHLKDEFRVPVSQRKPLDDVLVLNPPLD